MNVKVNSNLLAQQDNSTTTRLAIAGDSSFLSDVALEAIRAEHNLADISAVITFLGLTEA